MDFAFTRRVYLFSTICLSLATASPVIVGILHDKSWKSVNSLYQPSLAALKLVENHIRINPRYKVTSRYTSPTLNPLLGTEKWNKIIVFAKCKESQRIARKLPQKSVEQAFLFLLVEYCDIPKKSAFIYLKLAQDCPGCFQKAVIDWLNGDAKHAEYNGDHLNMLEERNTAAKEFLQRRSFKLGTVDFLNFLSLIRHQNGTVTPQGIYMDWVNDIVRAFKINYTLTLPSQPWSKISIGGWFNGSWNGLASMAYRRKIDCAFSLYITSGEAIRDMDVLTSATSIITTSILIGAPDFRNDLSAVLKPFQFNVWLLLTNTAFVVVLVLGCLNRNETSYLEAVGKQIVIVSQMLLSQGTDSPIRRLPCRFVVGAWSIVALTCGYVYTSILTSSIMVPKPYPLVNSLTELADNNRLEVITLGLDFQNKLFAHATEGAFARIKERLKKNAGKTEIDNIAIVKNVRSGKFAFIGSKSFLEFLIDKDYVEHQQCAMMIAKEPISMELVTWLFPKNSATSLVLNLGYLRIMDHGILQYSTVLYRLRNKFCRRVSDYRQPNPVVTLDKTKSLFFIFAVGIPIATVTFLCEAFAQILLVSRRYFF